MNAGKHILTVARRCVVARSIPRASRTPPERRDEVEILTGTAEGGCLPSRARTCTAEPGPSLRLRSVENAAALLRCAVLEKCLRYPSRCHQNILPFPRFEA